MSTLVARRCESCGTALREVNRLGGEWLCLSCAWPKLPIDTTSPLYSPGATRDGKP